MADTSDGHECVVNKRVQRALAQHGHDPDALEQRCAARGPCEHVHDVH